MKKFFIFTASGLLIICIMLLALNTPGPAKQPKRRSNIPATAVWDGGVDGGNWIECKSIDSANNIFHCTVYNDFSGDSVYDGTMKLEGPPTSEKELRYLLGTYSGNEIYLKDNRILHSVIKADTGK